MTEILVSYWVADCKTKDCGTLLLAKIGPVVPFKIPFLLSCADFEVTCGTCMKEYTYSREDVYRKEAKDRPNFEDARSFVVATQPVPRQDEP